MCVLYGPAEADGSLPSEPAAAAAVASELDIDCFSADAMQYTAELARCAGNAVCLCGRDGRRSTGRRIPFPHE